MAAADSLRPVASWPRLPLHLLATNYVTNCSGCGQLWQCVPVADVDGDVLLCVSCLVADGGCGHRAMHFGRSAVVV